MATAPKTVLADTTVIQANQFPIKSVKLFRSGCAEVTRKFPLPFLRSQNDSESQVVEIVNLPIGLSSVNVSVTSKSGNVTILDHYYTSLHPTHPLYKSKMLSPALRELEKEQIRLEDERRFKQQSVTFLTTYTDALAQCKSERQAESAQIVSFFDEFVEMSVSRTAVVAELDDKLTDIDKKIEEERDRLSKLCNELPVRVVVVLTCDSLTPVEDAELTLTYAVKQVHWKPTYDLHIAMTEDTPSPVVKLDFRCSVTQWTGENWENVSLALTTADQVSQLIQVPEPKRIDVSLGSIPFTQTPYVPAAPMSPVLRCTSPFYGPPAAAPQAWSPIPPLPPILPPTEPSYRSPYDSDGANHERRRRRSWRPSVGTVTWPNNDSNIYGPPPQIRDTDEFSLIESVRSATPVIEEAPAHRTVSQLIAHGSKDLITHIADGSVFIPSDRAEHHALVASLPLRAEFMRVAVPSVDTRVYYTCEVKNTSEHVLLPGTVKTYLNDKHVSSTKIQSTDLPQILECCLAVDTGVKTIHNRAPDPLPSMGAFTGKTTTTYTSAIVVQNTRSEAIRGLIVRTSIPLPADPRITIVLKEPVGLGEIDEGSTTVKEGCLARWSTAGGRQGKEAGLFEWECNVNPGTEVLKAVWEVRAPQDFKLSEQVRD